MASLMIACITVGEQIIAEQLIEECIVMKLYKAESALYRLEGGE